MAFYADTSALTKLVTPATETEALRAWLVDGDRHVVTSDLVRTELMRTIRRRQPDAAPAARQLLDVISIGTLPSTVFDQAAGLSPTTLRSLDALHLAAALRLGDDLEGLITYDHRLAAAAEGHGVTVIAPT